MKLYGNKGKKGKHVGGRPAPRDYRRETQPAAQEYSYTEYRSDERRRPPQPRETQPVPPVRKKKKKNRGKKVVLVLVILAALAVGAAAAWNHWVRPPEQEGGLNNPVPPATTTPTSDTQPPTETPEEWVVTDAGRKTYCHTFVIAAFDEVSQNTDTMMVGMLDRKEGKLNICSIPRDTLVNVGWNGYTINTVYKNCKDDDEFKDYLADILGFRVDSIAIVDIDAVAQVVDAIGGITYNVPINMNYDDPVQDLHIHINAGEQWLSGEDTVKVLRWRQNNDGSGYPMGDIGRIETQQDLLKSVFKQMLTLGNIPNLSKAAKIFEENVTTDLTAANIVWYATEALKLDSENINFMMTPGNQSVMLNLGNGNSKSVVSIYVDEWLEMLNTYLNPFEQQISQTNLDILTFEGADPYHGLGTYKSTSGEIVSSFFRQWNQYNGG